MNINKSMLKTFWYEDQEGKEIKNDDELVTPDGAHSYVTRSTLEIREVHHKIIKQDDVNKCPHKSKWIKRTGGWVKGIKGRECQKCHGIQVRKNYQAWGNKWEAGGSRKWFVGTTHIGLTQGGHMEETIMGMVNSGDYSLKEAILVYSIACERCMNVLIYKYTNREDGYYEYSQEWITCGTHCIFCKDMPTCVE